MGKTIENALSGTLTQSNALSRPLQIHCRFYLISFYYNFFIFSRWPLKFYIIKFNISLY